jgi:hypothetical protein
MEQGGLHGREVHPQVRHDRGHGKRVLDEVLAGQALLSVVGGLGERVRSVDLPQVDLRVPSLYGLVQGFDGIGGLAVGRPEREPG